MEEDQNKILSYKSNIQIYNSLNYFFTIIFIILAFFLIYIWFQAKPVNKIYKRIQSKVDYQLQDKKNDIINIKGKLEKFKEKPSLIKVSWNNFRGPLYDNVNREDIPLNYKLDENNLPILWEKEVGEGYAAPSIYNGCVYLLDYDKKNKSDVLRCISLKNGKDIWKRSYKIPIKRNHGVTRTQVAVNDRYVVSIGPKCIVMCLDALSGDYKWGMDLRDKYNTKVPLWYTGQCPLIDNGKAIIAPGGDALMIGVELETGKIVFETPNINKFQMSHSSIIPMTFNDKKMYVYAAIGGIVGINSDEKNIGEIIWISKDWNHSVVSPSPVELPQNKFLITSGYGAGSMLFKVNLKDGKFFVKKEKYFETEKFACEQHTPIFYKNHLYTILPNDAGELNRQLICMDLNGKLIWSSGKKNKFGLGPFIIADNKIFILNDHGVLTICEANTDRYIELSETRVLSGRESWAPIIISNGIMIIRDFNKIKCLKMSKGEA